ncbi:MAG: hypothetical protein DI586_09950 [Micavibrio aeruginosavorus]|uniref:Uncharacterized protein n=1 Tax=Micavibrio aeruginosavorus TaxID=349221 RepID=A0A2W5FKX9_9BACT|nr:MAG: hypothetical protein DI586_09950 [Micavibrio aeruginosavorus]
MTFGSYNPRRRYIERDRKRNNAVLAGALVILAVGMTGFWLGRQHAIFQINSLKKETEETRAQMTTLQDELTKLRAETQTANSRFNQLQQQYQQELPDEGPIRDLVGLVTKQISDGMSAERLAFVIRSARPPNNCSDPASKRFMVKTPAYTGPDSSASFGEGAVLISGIGASTRNQKGEPQAWFDASQPVTVTFKTAEGLSEQKTSALPIQYSQIAKGREYRFTLSEGEKSFIKVTYDSCDYP